MCLRVVSTKTELLKQVDQLVIERDELALEVNPNTQPITLDEAFCFLYRMGNCTQLLNRKSQRINI